MTDLQKMSQGFSSKQKMREERIDLVEEVNVTSGIQAPD